MEYKILDGKDKKIIVSENLNHYFDKKTGFAATWGKTKEEDPDFSPIGPFILDIEITTKCNGVHNKLGVKAPCSFCYKSNTPNGKNMSFDTFKSILDKLPITLGQIAFGADSELTSNPDLWKMMDYSLEKGIIPNITTAHVSDDVALNLKKHCGAVAISRYSNKDICYDSVKKLTDLGMTQINIHQLVSTETLDQCFETIEDMGKDDRLKKMNAIVFLHLKKKGKRNTFNYVSNEDYSKLIEKCLEKGIRFGFDSCSANKFLDAVKDHPNYGKFKQMAEPCESTCFSLYIDVDGKVFPCSFCEGENEWTEGIDVISFSNFVKEVWNCPKLTSFRNNLIACGRNCPMFQI
jgi:MoaA/NifB/PqqE/SkfB family radical SAM enzyme